MAEKRHSTSVNRFERCHRTCLMMIRRFIHVFSLFNAPTLMYLALFSDVNSLKMVENSVFMGYPPPVCDGPPDVMVKFSIVPNELQYKGFLFHLVRGLQLFWWLQRRMSKSGLFYFFSDFDRIY